MINWKEIFREIKKYKKELILGHIFAFLAIIVSVPTPLILPLLVDEVLLEKEGIFIHTYEKIFGKGDTLSYVFTALIIVLLMRFFFFIFSAIQVKIFTTISKDITYKIRKKALQHLEKVSMAEYETIGTGAVVSKVITDINTIDDFIGKTVSKLIISVFMIIGIATVLIIINWKLGLLIVLLNPVVIYITTKIGRKVGKLKALENKKIEKFQEYLTETLELFWQIRASNKEKDFIEKIIKLAKDLKDASIEFNWKNEAGSRLSMFVFLAGYELFRSVSILFVAYSELTIGLMLAIFGYLWVMITPVQELLAIQYAFHSANEALKRVNSIFSMKVEPDYPHLENPFKDEKTVSITLKNVWFSYDGINYVLENINMNIGKGKKIAIVGASGSGKTTLANIIVGFYPISKGRILYNNIPVERIGLDIVRDNVYLVLQNPMLFNDTLRFNLTLGENIPENKIWEALEIAQLKDFVKNLPDRLDTYVGKNGVRLSGGQKQRLAIARMILANPKVVILDEATSALDVKTETKLIKALEEYLQEKTVIYIAHRLSTVRKADYIYVLDKGKIIEEGTHEELMKRESLYSSFYQFFCKT
ncbi:MAG: ABC transporter ATP-binding protein [Persephonella sp.]|nr:MAG: ABC transporter ATP-binding protein [Persephonella sp.]RUM60987.1 MAG: ABC transporter ATP-binding protein [Persephonella sp.]